MPPPTTRDLVDDLIVLASVRGDGFARERWLAARARLMGTTTAATSPGETGNAIVTAPSALEVDAAFDALETSGWVLREQAIAELPTDLRWLFEAGAVTVAQLEPIARGLNATTLADLIDAVEQGAVRRTSELGSGVEEAIVRALPTLRTRVPPVPIGRALAAADPLLAQLRGISGVVWAQPCGSLRRGHDLVGDVEIVACTDRPQVAIDAIVTSPDIDRVAYRSPHRVSVAIGATQVSVRCTSNDDGPSTLLCATGSRGHLQQLHAIARGRQLTLGAAGLFDAAGRRRGAESEEALYAALGLPLIPPELRRGDDEIERARMGGLPDLVEQTDIRGDLHMHTTWSDGRDSVESMVQAAVALGYQFVAITDHSQSSEAAKNLMPEDVSRQADEIARARERFPQIAILHGCEVDILPDGTLDFPEKTLRRFDIVLASLHDRAGHSSQQLLRRYLAAMVHPLVTIVTHPANRLFPRRAGYDLDYERLFEAAVETRTVLEIDGAPSHIDLDAMLAARAVGRGVTVSIDSDAHAANQLERHMRIGVLTARRAAVERRHVLNVRPLPEIRALIAGKRSRFPV